MGLLEVSWMHFIRGISNEIKWKVKGWCYSKYHHKLNSWNVQQGEMEGEWKVLLEV